MTVRRLGIGAALLVLLAVGYLALSPLGQQPDRSYDVTVSHPTYTAHHPFVLMDEGHYNAHTAGGLYLPFAGLLARDGYELLQHRAPFTPEALRGASVLVIANAAGGSNPKLFGINLVFLRKGRRDAPAFSPAEIAAVREWVRGGGALLLIASARRPRRWARRSASRCTRGSRKHWLSRAL